MDDTSRVQHPHGDPSLLLLCAGRGASPECGSSMNLLDAGQWVRLLDCFEPAHAHTVAKTYESSAGTASHPVRVKCSDGFRYYVKGPQTDRTPFNEQVIGCLGHRLGAPIPPVRVVELTSELHAAESAVQHMPPGPLHGSRFCADCNPAREDFRYFDQAGNRARFAALCILYTWMDADDHQFLYRWSAPNLVISVDHAYFFGAAGGAGWDIPRLNSAPGVASLDPRFALVGLTSTELRPSFARLAGIGVAQIAKAVARPPIEWGVTMAEQAALCAYLQRRQHELLRLRR